MTSFFKGIKLTFLLSSILFLLSNVSLAQNNNNNNQIIVEFEYNSSRPALLRGRNTGENLNDIAETIANEIGLQYRHVSSLYTPVHEKFTSLMSRKNSTESDLIAQLIYDASRTKTNNYKMDAVVSMFSNKQDFGLSTSIVMNIGSMDINRAINAIKNTNFARFHFTIKDVYKNELIEVSFSPNDPYFQERKQLSLYNINALNGWDLEQGSPNTVIAIIDTGVNYNHEDLRDNMWRNPREIPGNGIDDDGNGFKDDVHGFDFVDGETDCEDDDCDDPDGDPMDSYGHGTHVAGIAAASTNNRKGIAGVCPNCKVMALRAGFKTRQAGLLSVAAIKASIAYAVQNGADVINMSFGSVGQDRYNNELKLAHTAGVALVAAAGNSNTSQKFYPAANQYVISVAALNGNDSKANFSNYGSWITVGAPGTGIYSTYIGTPYRRHNGTSMAAPHVAGLVGLIASQGKLNVNNIKEHIRTRVKVVPKLAPEFSPGFGMIDVHRALSSDNNGIVISGKVTKNSIGVQGVTMKLNVMSDRYEQITDENGEFSFKDVSPRNRRYVLRPTQEGSIFEPLSARGRVENSEVHNFEITETFEPVELTAPVLISPKGVINTDIPNFSWSRVNNASSYDIEVYRNNIIYDNTSKPLYSKSNITGTIFKFPDKFNSGFYTWRARAKNSTKTSEWSSIANFNIVLQSSLNPPALLAPKGTIDDRKPTFSWTRVNTATSYDLEVRDSKNVLTFSETQITDTKFTATVELKPDTYSYQVRAKNSSETSSWARGVFTISNNGNGGDNKPPKVLSPVGTTSQKPLVITLERIPGVERYSLALKGPRGQTVSYQVFHSGPIFQIKEELFTGKYSIIAKAHYGDAADHNNSLGWSEPHYFNYVRNTGGGFEQPWPLTPGSGSTVGAKPTFTWRNVYLAKSYNIYIFNVTKNKIITLKYDLDKNTYTHDKPLETGRYYYMVNAKIGLPQIPYSGWSIARYFNVESDSDGGDDDDDDEITGTPFITEPAVLKTSSKPMIRWNVVGTTTHFQLLIKDLNQGQVTVLDKSDIKDTFYQINDHLTLGHSYRIWVKAFFKNGTASPWSSNRDFKVEFIHGGGNGSGDGDDDDQGSGNNYNFPRMRSATYHNRQLTLISERMNVSQYEFWVNQVTKGGDTKIFTQLIDTNTFTTSEHNLLPGSYKAWVRGIEANGQKTNWSAFITFTVTKQNNSSSGSNNNSSSGNNNSSSGNGTSTNVPKMTSASYSNRQLTLVSQIMNVSKYNFWLSQVTANGDRRVFQETSNSNIYNKTNYTLAIGNYKVWVRGKYSNGQTTNWSPFLSFTVTGQNSSGGGNNNGVSGTSPTLIKPKTPNFLTPANDAIVERRPTITWEKNNDAIYYNLFIRTQNGIHLRKVITTNSYMVDKDFMPGVTYYATVQTIVRGGNQSNWSFELRMHGQSSNSSSGSSSSSSGSNNTNNFKVLQPRGIINERMTLVKWEEVSNASSYSLEVKKGNTVFYTENNMSRPSAIIKRHLLATPEDYIINVTANMPNGTKIKSESQKFNYFAGGKYEDFFLEDGSPRIKPKILLPVQIGALDNHANFKWTPVKDAASYIYRVVEYKTTYKNTWDSKPRNNTTYLETQHLGRRKNKYVIIIALDENNREISGSLQYPLYQKDAQSHSQNGQSSQTSSSVSNSNGSGSSSSANSSSSSSGASSSGASNSGTSNSNSSTASNSNSGSGNTNSTTSSIATITSPARSVTSNTVTFRWRAVTGARTYLLWVDNLTTGEKRKIYLPNLTSTQHTQTLSNGRYRMWVRPNNSSRWESPYEFTVASTSSNNSQTAVSSSSGSTNSNTSSIATITSPASRVTSNNVTFRWTPVTNASQYELWVDNITTGVKKIIHKTNLRTTQHTQSLSNGNYKMWVRANNSSWTGPYSFTVASTSSNNSQTAVSASSSNSRNSNSNAATKAIITSPASNRLTDNAVTFEWTPVHNALEYELLVENLTTRVYAFINLKGLKDTKYTQYINNGRYRMWVRSNNSSWSNSFTFTVANGRF